MDADISMEDLSLLKKDKERIRDCLEGKISYEEAMDKLIQ